MRKLVWTNLVVAALVAFSNGLALAFGKNPPGFVYVTVPLAVLVVALSSIAIVRRNLEMTILKLQTIFLLAVLMALLWFTFDFTLNGLPEGAKRVAWNPILFAFVCAYPVYLARRMFFDLTSAGAAVRYAHLGAILFSIFVSAFVMYRIAKMF